MSSAMNSSLKGLHDRLLAEKPDGAQHDPTSCPLCAMDEGGQAGDDMKTYSEEEFTAAVEAATADVRKSLDDRIAELEASAQTTEVEQAKAALRASYEPRLAELQRQLDSAVLEAANAGAERDAIKTWLEDEAVAAKEAETAEARKDQRLAKVREVANFPQEYLDGQADRIAAMSDEDFEAACESWAALSAHKANGKGDDTIPDKTALHAARDGATTTTVGSAVKEMFDMRRQHGRMDLTTL
jgi:hypothetical protein